MLTGDPHAQHPGPDAEVQRRFEDQRFSVDAGGDRSVGVDLERRRRPFAHRALQLAAVLPAARRPADDGHAEQAVVDPGARAGADRAAEPVAVVRDEHDRAGVMRLPARAGPAQIELMAAGAERVRHGVEQRPQLGAGYCSRCTASA